MDTSSVTSVTPRCPHTGVFYIFRDYEGVGYVYSGFWHWESIPSIYFNFYNLTIMDISIDTLVSAYWSKSDGWDIVPLY